MSNRLLLVPELNYWMRIVLHNNCLNEQFFKLPVPISEELGRCPGSVIDLLFNECFVPVPELSSSSQGLSSSTDIGVRQIPNYYFFNDHPEVEVLQSIPCTELSSSSSTPIIPEPSSSSSYECSSSSCYCEPFGKFEYFYKGIDRSKITDKNILQRITVSITKIDIMLCNTWWNETYFSEGNACLGVYLPVNLFNITNEELCLLCKLYDYKTDKPVTISDVCFNLLESCLSKTIYVYLDWEINESLQYFNLNCFSDNNDLLRSLYEKHVIDHIYRILSLKFYITHNISNIDYFLELNYNYKRFALNETNIETKTFEFSTGFKPYNNRSTILMHKGVIQKYGIDYEIITDSNEISYVKWNHNKFEFNDEIYFTWSFLDV